MIIGKKDNLVLSKIGYIFDIIILTILTILTPKSNIKIWRQMKWRSDWLPLELIHLAEIW